MEFFSQHDKKEGTLYAVFQIDLELFFLTTLTNTSIIFLEIGELHDILFPNINKNQAMIERRHTKNEIYYVTKK